MLAPRKHLWSTPIEALEQAVKLLQPGSNDNTVDIGAGEVCMVMIKVSLLNLISSS